MGWIAQLCETYERNVHRVGDFNEDYPLLPIYHTTQPAHIEVTIDGKGNFKKAKVVSKNDSRTIVPCTEESLGRAGIKPVNHPLHDKLQYVAGDFVKYGGVTTKGFSHDEAYENYLNDLEAWVSRWPHQKLNAVLKYAEKASLTRDLVDEEILKVENGNLIRDWQDRAKSKPEIYQSIQDQTDSFVRWAVEIPGDFSTQLWKDKEIWQCWITYVNSRKGKKDVCFVKGEILSLPDQHPKKILPGSANAKLISSNDTNGFTYRGRFIDANQAATISLEASQKAHNALAWLIRRQGYWRAEQSIVAWEVSGYPIPDPMKDSFALLDEAREGEEVSVPLDSGDVGQAFSRALSKKIQGYKKDLGDASRIIVMGLDAVTNGRASVTFYRELTGSEFLERIESWHSDYSWIQNYSKEIKFVGAPAPKDIAEAAYGRRMDDKIRKATIERLLPCIADGKKLPRDLVEITRNRAANRVGMENWEWEKHIGITCALFRGYYKERNFQMALEENRSSRDYLYGRLLAIAEHIESRALFVAGENRETNAAKLMHRFSERPYSTWLVLEMNLLPYKTRLQAKRPIFLKYMKSLLDEVHHLFQDNDYMDDRKLSGEFLLSYHCQRKKLWNNPKTNPENDSNEELSTNANVEGGNHE
ncbi:MAG TPA: type I-C CRISPR-associated protein Cas8c/Csd1 [Smithellaceae bacterium]|nr:type I-C CRISPR-associated protein Cas8c/Csd1 [Smithellaceae bacterium]